jgi:hypothetical protein
MFGRSVLLLCLATAPLAIPNTASAGANPNFTVPLHAMSGFGGTCQDYLRVDCVTHRPNVNVAPGVTTVFVFVANHTGIAGLATVANPGGLTALDCGFLEDGIDPDDPVQRFRLGSICVNAGGHDACDPLAIPVESATWGKIKDGYR